MTKVDDWIIEQQGLHFCNCGCATEINIIRRHHSKGIPKYISGHSNRGKKITPHSTEHKKKISEAKKGKKNPMYGNKHSPTSKQKMSDSHKAKTPWNKGLKGIKCGTKKGTKFSKSHCENISKSHKGLNSGSNHPMYGKHHTEETKQKISESRIDKYYGENNPNWNGGTSFDPYCHKFNNKLKERIRDRDNRTCQGCGCKENGTRLAIHHIHYDRENCYPDLIALCNSCHMKTNTNRQHWEEYYTNILETRGLLNWS